MLPTAAANAPSGDGGSGGGGRSSREAVPWKQRRRLQQQQRQRRGDGCGAESLPPLRGVDTYPVAHEDNMAFGKPVKYWKLDPSKVHASRPNAWDTAVHEASEEYKHHMHNLCCDNCHSHVALALNLMRYNNSSHWNMVKVCLFCLIYGKYVSIGAFVKTWLPFVLLVGIIVTTSLVFNMR
ncbi:transmembrane protein 222 isoform X2 [Monodelphis domestica]|uniref:transmembrane protein 222 isoform X2 n=1 Tax=Monodelphis domestica TaxID=13616 RepID=UPI0024E209B7|nr:transmembrane protein 222 isoform X2 [Monodelphis domestica]